MLFLFLFYYQKACSMGKPVVLQEILPFNGMCVETRARHQVRSVYPGIVNSCAAQGANVMTILLDYIEPNEAAFGLVTSLIKNKAAKLLVSEMKALVH